MTEDSQNNQYEPINTVTKAEEYSLIKSIKNLVRNIFGFSNATSLEDSVNELIEEYNAEGTKIGKEERILLHNILSFGELKVSDIMIPRTDIVAIEEEISFEELKQVVLEQEHTRMPVYKESLDNVTGFIHIKDMLPALVGTKDFKIDEIVRELLVISPSMKVIDLLVKMRQSRVHMALVLDEYGGTDGLVTIEDLMEEIVGEIQDEHDDTVEPELVLLDEYTIEASARLPIEKLEKQLNVKIWNEDHNDFDTLGGLILSLIGYVPTKGEKITHAESGIEFEVIDVDARRLKRLLIHKKQVTGENNDQ
ncbi:MAG: hemolysin family protein [Alphaproteobacteria bacterium]